MLKARSNGLNHHERAAMVERTLSTVRREEMTAVGVSRRDFFTRATSAAMGGLALANAASSSAAFVQTDRSALPPYGHDTLRLVSARARLPM
jgi:hypothetical protein